MNLRICLDTLERDGKLSEDMQVVGGGAKSAFWRSLFADIYGKNIVMSNVGEDAGSLGAMATAAIAAGIWEDYTPLVELNKAVDKIEPKAENSEIYNELLKKFTTICGHMAEIAVV